MAWLELELSAAFYILAFGAVGAVLYSELSKVFSK